MTKAELIEAMKDMPDDLDVCINVPLGLEGYGMLNIKEIGIVPEATPNYIYIEPEDE